VSINVLCYDYDDKYIAPLYASKHRNRQHHANLLLIENEHGDTHYILVSNLSASVADRTKYEGKTFVCPYCLHCMSQDHVLKKHLNLCMDHKFQVVE